MKAYLNFKTIKTKILFGFSLVILLTVLFSVYNYWAVSNVNKDTKEMVDKDLKLLIANQKLASSMSNRVGSVRGYAADGDKNYKDLFFDETEKMDEYEQRILDLEPSEEFKDIINRLEKWEEYVVAEVFDLYDMGKEDLAADNLANVAATAKDLAVDLDDLASSKEKIINDTAQKVMSNGETSLIVGVAISLLVVVIGGVAALVTARTISKPINLLMDRMKTIANGDLCHSPLEVKSRDEIGQLVTATNNMNENIRGLLHQVNVVSETVSSQSEELTQSAGEVKEGSEQIASTMQELASGSETQASSASDLSSTMMSFANEIDEAHINGGRIEQSSGEVIHMTAEGSKLMDSSKGQMLKIDQIVHDSVQKVKGLDKHSQEISKLIAVIQDISDQTNLLALNAAIEAARAGEHGKGFAVVANEVKKLAEQVSNSVSDITGIVTNIQTESSLVVESLEVGYKEVEQGTEQIEATGEKFNGIQAAIDDMVNHIKSVSESLGNIALTSQQMNSSIEDIAAISEESAAGIEQTSASAEQTTASMEEVAEGSRDLAKLAGELNELVMQFKL